MFYSAASNASLWKGVNYYKEGKVVSFDLCGNDVVRGVVAGNEGNFYDTTIDLPHPKRSVCNCPFAEGRLVICKHMVALYFTAAPNSFEHYEEDMRSEEARYELEEARWRKEELELIKKHVAALSAKEARERLVDILYQDALEYRYRNDRYW